MPDLSLQKNAQRLRIYIDEGDRWRGQPLEAALLETLRARGMAGATVFRGAAGFGAHSRIHTARLEVLSTDLPVVLEVVDSPEKIAAILTPEQKKRYEEMAAESQAARAAGGGGSGRIWIPGEDGAPKAISVRLGLTDGSVTEIVSGEIKEGSEIIVGIQSAASAPKASGAPGPRLF